MKKTLLFTSLTLVLVFSVFGGAYANKDLKLSKVETLKQRLSEFKEKVDNDVAQSFEINLDELVELDRKDVLNDEKYIGIGDKLMDVMIEQEDGDIIPSVYLDEENNELYILEKKSDGTNVLHKYQPENSKDQLSSKSSKFSLEWSEVEKEEADGEIIDFEEVE
ncbi:hypothetical protein [Brevibacillus invocatus]|uniref:hypothetical protein n=1 Tax=Brevibacillus invocatus TaxID=173959 RepID=UPI00203B0032|nr:hypothetical protein [Brevibacillus invocatus]MCM3079624.1 hypothetical protein [Brevibacillus invocatus]MCM3429822.1 hypothetical protein [Brevibacillus invocatus]